MEPKQNNQNEGISVPDSPALPPTPQVIGPALNSPPTDGANPTEGMHPGLSQPIYSHNSQPISKKKPTKLIAAVLTTVLLAGAGATFALNNKPKNNSEQTPAANVNKTPAAESPQPAAVPPAEESTVYGKLKRIQAFGGNFSADIPEPVQLKEQTADSVSYHHPKPNKPSSDVYTSIGVKSEAIGESDMPKVKQYLISQLKSGSVLVMNEIRAELAAGGNTNVQLGEFTDFKSGLIAPISLKDPNGTPGEGRIIVLFGKSELYTMTIGADKVVWDANITVFNQAINSIQIK